jgi:uncharacterized membrane protein YfcA
LVSLLVFVTELLCASALAGVVGSLVGLGGGVLIVPLLTLGFGMDVRLAVGASLVSVIATSTGAAVAYLQDRLVNLRVGVLLELATVAGALTGALIAPHVGSATLFLLFGVALLLSAVPTAAKLVEEVPQDVPEDPLAGRLGLSASYPAAEGLVPYRVARVPAGLGVMYVAGVLSGLLGIGSGALKVLAMDTAMRLPMKVSTATSNFMIGVTAAASAGVYFWRGDVPPFVAAPVALGVLAGASLGAQLLRRSTNRTVRAVFLPVLLVVSLEMLLRGLRGV